MGDSPSFQFCESDFEVVDEFLDGDDLYTSDNNGNMESAKNLLDGGSVNGEPSPNQKNSSKAIQVVKIEEDDGNASTLSNKQSQHCNAMDFTADISFDQLNDVEVMEHLSEIDNISLDPESFGIESEEIDADRSSLSQSSQRSNERSNKSTSETQDVILVEESSAENNKSPTRSEDQWYDELINSKVKTVVERFSKLARVLKFSYPCYRNCLDRIEAKIGTPVCKLDPPRRCPLNRTNINRWKFICATKSLMESADSMTEARKNVKKMWQLEPCEGSNTNTNNSLQMTPTFVIRAVKMFEDFINSLDHVTCLELVVKNEIKDDDVVVLDSDEKSSESAKTIEDECKFDLPPQWLWLLVRCNSKGELMMFATGKYITNSVMENLKQLFESGLGKNCNVKSLYCKTMMNTNNVQTSNTTFLVGTEALDEIVGELKIQLAPKTNFWLSTAGAEELAKTVEAFLDPPDLGTVIDIGCGLGLMGLSIARKCYQVIGIDSPSEVEEAEMTCELNKIKNAYFLMGEPAEMMTTIEKSVEWRRAFAIINANTNIGRTIEVMIGLRKIKNLRRIVMVTTLTKQSVRSILELTRPADDILGDPFVATRAAVVDTLPTGPQFEVVILMERRPLPQMLNAVLSQVSPDLVIQNPNKVSNNSPKRNNQQKTPSKKSSFVKNTVAVANRCGVASNRKFPASIPKQGMAGNKVKPNEKPRTIPTKKFVKNPFYEQPFKANNLKRNTNQKETSAAIKPQSHSNQYKLPSASRLRGNSSLHVSPVASRPQGNPNQHKSLAASRPYVNSRSPRKNTANLSFHMKNNVDNESFGPPHDSQKRKQDWNLESGSGRDTFIPDKRSRENDDHIRSRMSGRVESDLLQKVQEQQRLLEEVKQELTRGSSQVVDNFTAKEVQDMLNLAIKRTNQIQSQIPLTVWDRIAPPEHTSPDIIIQDEIMFKGRHIQEINQEDIVITTSNQGFRQTFDASWAYNRRSDVPPLEPNLVIPRDTYIKVKSDVKDHKLQHENDATNQNEARWVPPLCSRRPLASPTHSVLSTPKKLSSPSRGNFQQQTPILLQDIARPSRQFAPSQRSLSPLRQKIPSSPQDLMHRRISPPRRQVVSVGFGDEWDIPSRGASEQHANWQRTIDNRQPNHLNNRWEIDVQQDKFREGNNPNPIWDGNKSGDNNWANNSGSGGGGGDVWNRQQMLAIQPGSNQWQQQQQHQQNPTDNRFAGPSRADWSARGKEATNISNTRNETWRNANKRRWSEPQSNKNSWKQSNDKEDWNDLPEDARDPWGDDGGLCGPSHGNWNRNPGPNERSMTKDNWRNSGPPMMNSKSQWQANMNSTNPNTKNARWNGWGIGNDNMKKLQQNTNWPQGNINNSNNNGWRQQNSFGGFQQERPHN